MLEMVECDGSIICLLSGEIHKRLSVIHLKYFENDKEKTKTIGTTDSAEAHLGYDGLNLFLEAM